MKSSNEEVHVGAAEMRASRECSLDPVFITRAERTYLAIPPRRHHGSPKVWKRIDAGRREFSSDAAQDVTLDHQFCLSTYRAVSACIHTEAAQAEMSRDNDVSG